MPTTDEIENQEQLLFNYRHTLAQLLDRQSAFGELFIPPDIVNNIIEVRSHIRRIKSLLYSWGVPVTDEPDDLSGPYGEPLSGVKGELPSTLVSAHRRNRIHPQDNTRMPQEYVKAVEAVRQEMLSTMKEELYELRDLNKRLMTQNDQLQAENARLRKIIYPGSNIEGKAEIEQEIQHQLMLRKELQKKLRDLTIEHTKDGTGQTLQIDPQMQITHDQITEIEARIKILSYDLERFTSQNDMMQEP